MTYAVDRLERKGLVVRVQRARDQRFISLSLTKVGTYGLSVGQEQVEASGTEVEPDAGKHSREPEE
jgi:hypothetical protein